MARVSMEANEKQLLGKIRQRQKPEVWPLDKFPRKKTAKKSQHALLKDPVEDWLLCKEPKLSPEKYFYASGCLLDYIKDEKQRQRKALHALLCYEGGLGSINSKSLLETSDPEPDICKRRLPSASEILATGSQSSHAPTRARSRSSSPILVSSCIRPTARVAPKNVRAPAVTPPCHTQPGVSTTPPLLSFSTHIFSTAFYTPPPTPATPSTPSPIMASLLADSVSEFSNFRDQSASSPFPPSPAVWFNPNLNWPSRKRPPAQSTPSPSPPCDSHLSDGKKEKSSILPESILKNVGFKPIAPPQHADSPLNPQDQKKKVEGRRLKRLVPDNAIPGTSYFQKPCISLAKGRPKPPSDEMYRHLVYLSEEYVVPIETVVQAYYVDQLGPDEPKTGIYTTEERTRLEAKAGQMSRPQTRDVQMPSQRAKAAKISSQQAKDYQNIMMNEKTNLKKGGPYKNTLALENNL